MKNFVLHAEDGEVGRCKDFIFDDRNWEIVYMVADTRKWLPGRKVILAPELLGQPQWEQRLIPVSRMREEIEAAPPVEDDPPVSMRAAHSYEDNEQIPFYRVGPGGFGVYAYAYHPPVFTGQSTKEDPDQYHLRSAQELLGYAIQARDGDIGHVEDFLMDELAWAIRYLIIDTRNWLPGRKVVVSPHWVVNVSWQDRTLAVHLPKEAVRKSPLYRPEQDFTHLDEETLYNFYGLPPYWREQGKNEIK